MIKSKFIFAVSLISMLAVVNSANADVASKVYVDEKVGAVSADVAASVTGTGNVITTVSASGNTITATKGITAEETKNKVTTIRDTATATDTAYPSEKAVATSLEKKLENNSTVSSSIAIGFGATASSDNATVLGVGASANNALPGIGGIAIGNNASTNRGLAIGINAKAGPNGIAIGNEAKIEGEVFGGRDIIQLGAGTNSEDNTFKVGLGTGNYKLLGSDGKIPSERLPDTVLTSDDISGKVDVAQGSGAANKAVITNASGNVTTGTISSAMITDGAVTSAKIADGTITNSDISATAKIATSKIDGLATVATTGSFDDLTDKPTIPEAITVDSVLSSTSTNPVQNKIVKAELDKKLTNTATAADALSTGDAVPATVSMAIAIGKDSESTAKGALAVGFTAKAAVNGTAIGGFAKAIGQEATALGVAATANADNSIQLGRGTNSEANTFSVGFGQGKNYKLLGSDGKIPSERMPNTIPVGSSTATTYATMWVE